MRRRSRGLIFQAVSLSKGGEIFILKMGDSVRIADMAKNLILLSGLEPGKDIEIKFTGLTPSEHGDILILRGENQPSPDLREQRIELQPATRGKDAEAVVRRLSELVPTFRPAPAHTPVPRAAN